ncbi:uncharacterized protein LOC110021186 isoform X1 [Phalaenopsis equestris]|uniref:uncharacterized protein LOC110021186 isoform X1 n=1 Tax=Phalaenopsis equestris TaxID=78828 RepID=UPI0009E54A46|nr:uncharacterized protein LOC110021186 isoform X1 [Phalaenopsis equestris]
MAAKDTTDSTPLEAKKMLIYPPSSLSSGRQVTPFWKEKYERESKRYWDLFYKRHKNKFFKDRHYLDKEWGRYFEAREKSVVLEAGCGVGNTIFPLVSTYPDIYIHACDFSPRAIDIVKAHDRFRDDQINAFVCDLTLQDLNDLVPSSSVDIVTMVFVLSAVAPEKMPLVLQNIRKVIKPNGHILIRDYAWGDLAQVPLYWIFIFTVVLYTVTSIARTRCGPQHPLLMHLGCFMSSCRLIKNSLSGAQSLGSELNQLTQELSWQYLVHHELTCKEQQISENFYVRGDGTRAYYFSEDFLTNLFKESGFYVKDISVCYKEVENRSKDLVMKRRWIQAVFSQTSENNRGSARNFEVEQADGRIDLINSFKDPTIDNEVDVSESIVEMFDSDPSLNEITIVRTRGYSFRIKGLSREHQHTCHSTGLMLWESALLMSNLISENPLIVAGKRVLELGCGSAGICSMISAQFAESVVSTDGDSEALQLLRENISSNLQQSLLEKIAIRKLIWGRKQDLEVIKELDCFNGGFEVIIGTDVSYSPEAISPLFFTSKELILKKDDGESKPCLILCHIERRVDEDSIVSAASDFGFRLVDRWVNGMRLNEGVISSWFSSGASWWVDFQSTPLTILYFEL